MSEVKTLHGFARGIMGKATGSARVYPKLSIVIAEDAEILKGVRIDFDSLFYNRDDKSEHIAFYKARKAHYAHYGFADIIYAAALYLEQHDDKIPVFDQVLVDEFQDFNSLEVSLIELLASRSPTLIVGDDDQSLYFFKNADAGHIRKRHSSDNKTYESFNLPYCSRCTRVIVNSVNDIISSATAEGFLKDRIKKPYIYFEDEKKEEDCKRYPQLTHVRCFSKQVPYFIATSVGEIAAEQRQQFSVLVIAPTKSRCRKIARGLRQKGFENIPYVDAEPATAPTLLESLRLLVEDPNCNLGWRIAAKNLLSEAEFKTLLEAATRDEKTRFRDFIDSETKKRVRGLLSKFKKVLKGQTISVDDSTQLFADLQIDPHAVAQDQLRATVEAQGLKRGDPATRDIPIKVTTIPSSKGLAEDYVFIVDFDDRFFLEKDKSCSDQKIFDFLVALTRARKKVFLISCDAKQPKFLTWIEKSRFESITLEGR